jgi:hypothetical protein
VATCVNFFNPDDLALGWWELNQSLKPDNRSLVTNPSNLRYYEWSPQYDFFVRLYHMQSTGVYVNQIDRLLDPYTDKFEIFSKVAEARCWATGAQPDIGGSFGLGQQVNLKSTFRFGKASSDHSAEFNSAIQLRYLFWEKLLQKCGIFPPHPLSESAQQ